MIASLGRLVCAVVVACTLIVAPVRAEAPQDAAPAPEKVRIAVVDFDTDALKGNWHYGWPAANLGRAATDELMTALFKTGRFRVIERQQLNKILAEQNLAAGGRIDASTAAKVGKILGVQAVVIGSVVEFSINEMGGKVPQIGSWKGLEGVGAKVTTGKAALTARLVDTTTAEMLGAYDGSGSYTFAKGEFAGGSFGTNWNSGIASKVLHEAVHKLARDIKKNADAVSASTPRGGLEGKIAKVEGEKIYVNLGGASGVKSGDRFEVRHLGDPIKDPDTGEVLGGEETVAGEIEIVKIIGEKLSIAHAVKGAEFKTGDKIVMQTR